MAFQEMDLKTMQINPFTLLNDEWGLVSAGTAEKYNTMTVSWGTLGIMWNRPISIIFLRPQRYTKEFVDNLDLYTLSFYPKEYKKALGILGSKSGRDGDKIKESGLTPYFLDDTIAFKEAHTIYICRKLFGGQQLDASKFTNLNLDSEFYPAKDYHYAYFGEIEKVLVNDIV